MFEIKIICCLPFLIFIRFWNKCYFQSPSTTQIDSHSEQSQVREFLLFKKKHIFSLFLILLSASKQNREK